MSCTVSLNHLSLKRNVSEQYNTLQSVLNSVLSENHKKIVTSYLKMARCAVYKYQHEGTQSDQNASMDGRLMEG